MSCRHARARTVMLELHGDGTISQRTYCGTIERDSGRGNECGHIFTGGGPRQVVSVEAGFLRVRVGHRAFQVSIVEIDERHVE